MPEQTNQTANTPVPVAQPEPTKRPPKNLPSFGSASQKPTVAPKFDDVAKTSFGVETIVGGSNTSVLDTAEAHFETAIANARDYAKKNKVNVTVRGTLYWQVPQKNIN